MKTESSFTDVVEEKVIAGILGLMTVLTFSNVIARYVFNSNILWALELTVFLFAWLVLLGASYAVKKGAHLGVDVLINLFPEKVRRALGLFAAFTCIGFAFLLLKGSWDYWANFANLPATEGRWFPTGFEDKFREKGWYEVNDIPMPETFAWLADIFNEGEPYEKIPRFIPYLILPLSMFLLLVRFCQAFWMIWTGKTDRIIASHEVEDELEEIREQVGKAD
ncbi:TRAP transporter small permease [Enterovibrio norvegicus]|uniref:TRAP transporter small permease n=1 Tax=Enterovibrio norvegicus TaxID=188144 RepID=UPI000C84DE37|nr:TRAP transporter small permease [Enterovibrio norvegicus]PMN68567.1 C4-dicarboxylate ABC transporter substrate-binding protein [Enterovibrio norvegicus]